jgi:hypothetical protein
VPDGEYLAALLRRFRITIWNRSGSTTASMAYTGESIFSS